MKPKQYYFWHSQELWEADIQRYDKIQWLIIHVSVRELITHQPVSILYAYGIEVAILTLSETIPEEAEKPFVKSHSKLQSTSRPANSIYCIRGESLLWFVKNGVIWLKSKLIKTGLRSFAQPYDLFDMLADGFLTWSFPSYKIPLKQRKNPQDEVDLVTIKLGLEN